MVKVRERKNRVGAPTKPNDVKKDPNTGLTRLQKEWVRREAKGRGVHTTDIMREAVEMYITALESQRSEGVPLSESDKKE